MQGITHTYIRFLEQEAKNILDIVYKIIAMYTLSCKYTVISTTVVSKGTIFALKLLTPKTHHFMCKNECYKGLRFYL